jgi:hypothetical protein
LVRAKKSADGSEWLVIACNPYNRGVERVTVRDCESTAPLEFELVGDYPRLLRFTAQQ